MAWWFMKARRTWVGFLLVLGFVATSQATIALPDLGLSADRVLSPAQERAVGRAYVNKLRNQNQVIDLPILDEYINDLGYRLVSSAGSSSVFSFFVTKDTSINAFALPGGYVGVNAGLILAARNVDEMAGVLAHEITHVTQRHVARAIESMQGRQLATLAAALGAVLATGGNGDVIGGALSAAMASLAQGQIQYTYANEEEADRLGIMLLQRAGFDPMGMPLFFERLMQSSRYYENEYSDFLRDHPVTSARIAEAKERVAAMGVTRARSVPHSTEQFAMIQALVMTMVTPHDEAALSFKTRLASNPNDLGARFGLAWLLADRREGAQAVHLLAPLVRRYATLPIMYLALAQAQTSAKQPAAALESYRKALLIFPDDYPLALAQAQLFVAQDRPTEARAKLLALPVRYQDKPELMRTLAEANAAMGNRVESHYYLSEYYLLSGQAEQAMEQLRVALAQKENDEFNKMRAKARLSEIEKALKEARKFR
jgi:predicted Zn-dependent protease